MRTWFVIFTTLLLFGCSTSSRKEEGVSTKSDSLKNTSANFKQPLTKAQKDSADADSIAENIIADSLFSLPKIKKFADQISSNTHDSLYAEAMFGPPTNKAPYYWVHVGYQNDDVFETEFHFKVEMKDKKIIEIKNDSVAGDSLSEIVIWRETRRAPNK